MAEDDQKKTFLILTVCISLVAVGLNVASFATDNWVKFSGSKLNNTELCTRINNSTHVRCKVEGRFGLFRGDNTIDYTFGLRARSSRVICSDGWCIIYSEKRTVNYDKGKKELNDLITNYTGTKEQGGVVEPWEYGLFRFGYWVGVLVMFSIAIVWGLVCIGFTVFNIFGKPIETITGPLGLYLWNLLALIFSLLGVIIYVVLFQTNFANNVLPGDDYQIQTFRTKGHTSLDYSFYFTVGSLAGYLFNLLLLMFSGYKLRCVCTQEADKAIDNGIILY